MMMILFCCFACYSVRALRWVLGGAATSCGLWRFFPPTFAEHDMLFSILLSSDALYVFSINQPQHTCGQKTPTLEQISVVCHIIFSKTSTSPRGALSLHSLECININNFRKLFLKCFKYINLRKLERHSQSGHIWQM